MYDFLSFKTVRSFLAQALIDLPFLCAQNVTNELAALLSTWDSLCTKSTHSVPEALHHLTARGLLLSDSEAFGVGGHPVLPVPLYLLGTLPY